MIRPGFSVRTVIAGYVRSRVTTGEPPMETADLDALDELLRRIFNGLFDK